jgi:hypothetical protein
VVGVGRGRRPEWRKASRDDEDKDGGRESQRKEYRQTD